MYLTSGWAWEGHGFVRIHILGSKPDLLSRHVPFGKASWVLLMPTWLWTMAWDKPEWLFILPVLTAALRVLRCYYVLPAWRVHGHTARVGRSQVLSPGHLALESAPLPLLLQIELPWAWALERIALIEGLGKLVRTSSFLLYWHFYFLVCPGWLQVSRGLIHWR